MANDVNIRVALQGMEGVKNQLDMSRAQFNQFGASVSAIATAVSAAVSVAFSSGIAASAVNMAGKMEQATLAFTTMLGSAEKAQTFLKDLAHFAATTPFEFMELQDATKRMMALGFAADEVIPTMTAVGDAVAGLGGGAPLIHRITLALGQMKAKGKVSGEEMRQLAEAGIPAWEILAKAIGVSIPEAMQKAQKGAIQAAEVVPVLIKGMGKRFEGLMNAQSKTMLGAWSNLHDSMDLLLWDIGKSISQTFNLGDIVSKMSIQLTRIREWWNSLTPAMKSVITQATIMTSVFIPLSAAILGAAAAMSAFGISLKGVIASINPWVAAAMVVIGVGTLLYTNWVTVSHYLEVAFVELSLGWKKSVQEILLGYHTLIKTIPGLKQLFPDVLRALEEEIGILDNKILSLEATAEDLAKGVEPKLAKILEMQETKAANYQLGLFIQNLQSAGTNVYELVTAVMAKNKSISTAKELFEALKKELEDNTSSTLTLKDQNKDIEKVFDELNKTLQKNNITAKLQGELFDKNKADASAYMKAIEGLIDEGLKPEHQWIENLGNVYKTFSGELDTVERVTITRVTPAFFSLSSVLKEQATDWIPKLKSSYINLKDDALTPAEKAFGKLELQIGILSQNVFPDFKKTTDQSMVHFLTKADLIQTAGKGLADAIKNIWEGTAISFRDVWTGALNVFVDIIVPQMVAVALGAAQSIQWGFAAATAGITLIVGLFASLFGGKKNKVEVVPLTTRLKEVFDNFVSDFKSAIGDFKEYLFPASKEVSDIYSKSMSLLNTLKAGFDLYNLRKSGTNIIYETQTSKSLLDIFKNLMQSYGGVDLNFTKGSPTGYSILWANKVADYLVPIAKKLSENLVDLSDLMVQRFDKIKDIVGEILDLYRNQKDFVKDMNRTITDVQRALLAPQDLIQAQVADVDALKIAIGKATGEEQLTLIGELKDAYLSVWGTAQDLFSEDMGALLWYQDYVVSGLEAVKESGKSAYDQLIDINLEMLGVQRDGKDIALQMTQYLSNLGSENGLITQTLAAILKIGETLTITESQMTLLNDTFRMLFELPKLASGGVVTKPTIAMIGEAGPEAVVPLGKMGKSGPTQVVVQGPLIMDEITLSKFVRKIQEGLRKENLRYA